MQLLVGLMAWAAAFAHGEDCIENVVLEANGSTNGLQIKSSYSKLSDGDAVVIVRKSGGEWSAAVSEDDYWHYIDQGDYKLGDIQKYEITVGDKKYKPLCEVEEVEIIRNDVPCASCVKVSISHIETDFGVVDGFETSEKKADVVIEVDGEVPTGHVLEASTDGSKWSEVKEVEGEYRYTLTAKDKEVKFKFETRLRKNEANCPSVSQDIVLDQYIPKFDFNPNVGISAGEVDIIDVDTTNGDDGIKYEIVSARTDCDGNYWADVNAWDAWTAYKFKNRSGYMNADEDNTTFDTMPYLEREISGLSGLTGLEFEVDVRGTSYKTDVDYLGTWANLDLLVDGVRYAAWQNFREVVPIEAAAYMAHISPRAMQVSDHSGPYTTFRIAVPWNGKSQAKLRFEFMASGDDFWVGKIMPRGGAATGICKDTAKALFKIDSKTGELKFRDRPESNENYSVEVKATTEFGEVGYVTINVAVD